VYPVTGKLGLGFHHITNIDDFWEWLNPGQFVSAGGFFPTTWYEGGSTDGTPYTRWFNQECVTFCVVLLALALSLSSFAPKLDDRAQ
jgi:hypothetical protein